MWGGFNPGGALSCASYWSRFRADQYTAAGQAIEPSSPNTSPRVGEPSHPQHLVHGHRERLLAHDVLARLERREHGGRVDLVGRADVDGVDAVELHQPPEVAHHVLRADLLGQPLRHAIVLRLPRTLPHAGDGGHAGRLSPRDLGASCMSAAGPVVGVTRRVDGTGGDRNATPVFSCFVISFIVRGIQALSADP